MGLLSGIPAMAGADPHHLPEQPVAGAGAHFAWVVFDVLKKELEERSNRKIILSGRNSALGVGCRAGIKMARQNQPGRETFGFVCCSLSKEEIRREGLIVYPLAKEPIMILVNKTNKVDDLTADQVRGIFAGRITNWREVGGDNRPIVVITRLHCKDRPGHWKRILPTKDRFRTERLNVKSAAEMIHRVNDFPGALGHTGSTWKFQKHDRVKIIRVNGYRPTAVNLRNGHYPFWRQLSAVTNRSPGKAVLAILDSVKNGVSFRKVTALYQLVPLDEPPYSIP